MIGTRLSHYRILESLAAGGTGEVYRAHDEHLDRDVAIKVLLPGSLSDTTTRERFRREAHVLSRLSHPGVATIYDFDRQDDVDFLVMEYVPGGSLQARLGAGPLALDEAMRLGVEIGDALEDAHHKGFLHRDLKPGNVVLTHAGAPKILDFGIARLLQESQTSSNLTQTGAVVGSLPYMAPEQLRGAADDERTDVYAFGVMLYEMVTGRRPFGKAIPEALIFEILHETPQPVRALRPEAPLELDRVIAECLSKDVEHRPATAGVVSQTLRKIRERVKQGAAPEAGHDPIRSLAVLPLDNVSRDPAQEYFADGMTDALISELSRLKALRVISRTSAMKYKGVQKALPEIARELNVDAIIEGSALLVGKRVRISARLVSARTDENLWAERYDGDLEDVLDLQGRVAATIAQQIEIQVTPREATRMARRQTVNPEAHIEYLKGKYALDASSVQAIEVAFRHFRRALELDPEYAPAWAGLAHCHSASATRGMTPPGVALEEAQTAAMKAMELDPTLAEAHDQLGEVYARQGDLAGSIRLHRKAIELNPGLAIAHDGLSRDLFCSERFEEAQRATLTALSLDPLSMIIHTCVGDAYYYSRKYETSLIYYAKAVEIDPRFDGAHTDLGRSLEAVGRFEEARVQYEEGRRVAGGVAGPSFGVAHLEISIGNLEEARRMLAELTAARSSRVVSAWGIATLHARLGELDETFRWLDTAVEERATGLVFLRVHPRIDSIRGDPRYPVLLKRVGLDKV